MCVQLKDHMDPKAGFQAGPAGLGEFKEAWEGRNWMDRFGIPRDFGETDDDYFDPETDVTPDTPIETPPDEIGFGGTAVGGKSDPSLKRRSRSSKNRLRKLMRKDLAIPTGRKVINVPGAS